MFQYKCLNPIAKIGLDRLPNSFHEVEDIQEAQAVLVRSASMHDLPDLPKLCAVGRAGAGTNNIPVDDYAKKGIVVFNAPGANANAVKELVLTGMLMASRDLIGGNEWVIENQEDELITKHMEKAKKKFAGTEIKGKNLGVIGLGAIGVLVSNAAYDLGMEVYGYDPYLSVQSALSLNRNVHHVTKVEDIYEKCDFITVHVPLLDGTKNMLDADSFAMMKDGVTILNFARNGLVDEDALKDAIASEKVHCYVTDFPTPKTAGQEGVIAFPHLGASTEESEDNCAIMVADEISDYMENGNINHSVNYPNMDMGICHTQGRVAVMYNNIPNMLTQFTGIFARENVNIHEMSNKSKGAISYALFDLDSRITEETAEKIAAIDGVHRVRIIK